MTRKREKKYSKERKIKIKFQNGFKLQQQQSNSPHQLMNQRLVYTIVVSLAQESVLLCCHYQASSCQDFRVISPLYKPRPHLSIDYHICCYQKKRNKPWVDENNSRISQDNTHEPKQTTSQSIGNSCVKPRFTCEMRFQCQCKVEFSNDKTFVGFNSSFSSNRHFVR